MTRAMDAPVADRLAGFGSTIFTEMSRLALEHDAVNLSQGFPDFEGPAFVIEAAIEAARSARNQYARSAGAPELCQAIAAHWSRDTGASAEPLGEVTVTCGATEAIHATLMGLVNPGDEVILFEPFYDSYRACVSMCGATPRFVTLRPPASAHEGGAVIDEPFLFERSSLESAFTDRTRALLLNTPHNPTGKVFKRDELELISELCRRHDVLVISDEVYEHLTYDGSSAHVRIATLPGMWERTVTISSIGKSFSLTGWKIGWAIAPKALTTAIRSAHQFITFCSATPLQYGAAAALREGQAYVDQLRLDYQRRRDALCDGLCELGMKAFRPAGSYFVLADHSALGYGSDVELCQALIERARVAAIPPSAFYANPEHGRNLVRFAFCKRDETLSEALRRLQAFRAAAG